MNNIIIYRCLMCGKQYEAEKVDFGISPNEINCHKCEGTATVIYIESFFEDCKYKIVKGNWKTKQKYRRTEANWYKRYGFSQWEIDRLFEYEERKIEKGMLILIKK